MGDTRFTKLFHSILASSIWRADMPTRIVWITMLAMADQDGHVWSSIGGLAHLAGVSRDECKAALDVLMSEDEDSRSSEYGGRRIVPVEGGWYLINYLKYRKLASAEDAREANARRQRDWRARQAEHVANATQRYSNATSQDVTGNNAIGEGEGEGEEEGEKNNNNTTSASGSGRRRSRRTKDDSRFRLSELSGGEEVADYFGFLWSQWPMKGTRLVERFGRPTPMEVPFTRGSRAMAERNFQAILDSGVVDARTLYVAGWLYCRHAETTGWCQHVSTFLGPEKATWKEWITPAKEKIASQDGAHVEA